MAEWTVIIVTALDWPASASRSVLRASHSMKAGSFSAATAGATGASGAGAGALGSAAAASAMPASRSCLRLSRVSSTLSCVSSNSCATPKNSRMFSTRLSASTVFSDCSAWMRPVRSMIISTTCERSPEKCRAASIVDVNPARAVRALAVSRPSSATQAWAAEKNEIPDWAAYSRMRLTDVVPMPRRGVFTTRSAATSSSGLMTSLR